MQINNRTSANDIAVTARAEQVRLLLQGIPTAVASHLVLIIITLVVLWNSVYQDLLLSWGVLFIITQLFRLWLWYVGKYPLNDKTTAQWQVFMRIAIFISGLGWGSLPVFLFPNDATHQLFLPFVAAGVTGAAVAGLAVDRVSVMLYIMPALIPLIVRLFMQGEEIHSAMGVMVTIYLIYLTVTSRRAEQAFRDMHALREQASRQNIELRELQQLARVGSWRLNLKTGKIKWSNVVYSIYARDQNSFRPDLTTYYKELIHPEDLASVQHAEKNAYNTPGQLHRIDHRVLLLNGEVVWVHIDGMVLLDANGQQTHIVGTVQDITERKNAESKLRNYQYLLRELAVQGVASREDELKHLAREIHDELGQLLTALRMEVSLLRIQFGGNDPALMIKIKNMLMLLDKTIAGVRTVATKLRPPALDIGVVPAIKWLGEEFSDRTGVICDFQFDDDQLGLDETRTLTLFRIVQESLTNVARYAQATHVAIMIKLNPENISIEVRDDGIGFDTAAISAKRSFGLMGMKERALAVSGKVVVTSKPGSGTTVFVDIPLLQKIQ